MNDTPPMSDRLYEEDIRLMENGWATSEVIMGRFLLMAVESLSSDSYEMLLLICRRMIKARSTGKCCPFRPDSLERCMASIGEMHNEQ